MQELELDEQQNTGTERRGISGREIVFGICGVLAGLLVLSGVWVLAGRNQTPFP